MGEKDVEEKKGKKPSSSSDDVANQSPPLERKVSLATADDSSDSEKEDEEDGEMGGASGSGQESRVSREGVVDSADSADSVSEKSTPPITEYIVNVVSTMHCIMVFNVQRVHFLALSCTTVTYLEHFFEHNFFLVQVRFLDAILSQNNTDDHMQEFIKQEGLEPMIKLLALTPLAAESTYATANTAIIDTCRNILVRLQYIQGFTWGVPAP